MLIRLWQFLFVCILLPAGSIAQKNLIIDNNLEANADRLKVKMGTQVFGKIWKFRFGEYAVGASKMGWTRTSSKSNLLDTKTDSKSSQKFSFELGNGSAMAKVNAASKINIQSLNELQLLPHIFLGKDEVIHRTDNFIALITINEDTTDTWSLLINSTRDVESGDKFEGLLTNGTRNIDIIPASSDKQGENNRSMPALGYQLHENNTYLAAVQYYGGGLLGFNKNIVWIKKDLDPEFKLLLAAAITAIMQIKVESPQ